MISFHGHRPHVNVSPLALLRAAHGRGEGLDRGTRHVRVGSLPVHRGHEGLLAVAGPPGRPRPRNRMAPRYVYVYTTSSK
jgi:hypothetical protein